MTQTAWTHLSNAKHIDCVIASLEAHPEKWAEAWHKTYEVVRHSTRAAAFSKEYNIVCVASWNAAWNAAWSAVQGAAVRGTIIESTNYSEQFAIRSAVRAAGRDTITALIAYDGCAYMIESELGELKILAKLGDQRAILLMPACMVFNETNCNCTAINV